MTLTDGPAIELMQAPWLCPVNDPSTERPGYAHIAISLGSAAAVDRQAAAAKAPAFSSARPAPPVTVSTRPSSPTRTETTLKLPHNENNNDRNFA
nr:hypothetical protein [Marinicella sp. W31]MDC2879400.1 hypothetical protein [Marinicella sp. W31]